MATAAAILAQWFNGRRTTGTDRSRQVGRGRRWSQFRRAAGSADASAGLEAAFRKGLGETSYVEGQNVTVEYHWLEGQFDRLHALMADLVRSRVDRDRHVRVRSQPKKRPCAACLL
jgi:hypothetical protein